MKILIDFETRSKIDLRKVGAYEYSMHPSTEGVCMAVKADKQERIPKPSVSISKPGHGLLSRH